MLNKDDLRHKVYNALSNISYEFHKEGIDLNREDFEKAYDWFKTRFFEFDAEYDEPKESQLNENTEKVFEKIYKKFNEKSDLEN